MFACSNRLKTDKFKIILGDIAPVFVCQIRFELESEKNISKHVQPWEKRRFLKHDEPFAARSGHRFAIGQHRAAVRFFQAGNDIEQGRFATAARADKTNEFAFGNIQTHAIKRQDRSGSASKTFGHVLDRELRGRDDLELLSG